MLPLGRFSNWRVFSTSCWRMDCVSTTGDAPVTVIVSEMAPTARLTLTGATKPALSSMPSRRTVEKPASENVTEYVPGRRSTML